MTHLCSFKVTHTKNTIWRRARISEAISSTPQACGVVFHHPRRSVRKVPIFYEEFRAQVKPINRRDRGGGLATDLPAGKKPFLPGGKTATLSAWCWVAFGEQTMVISRECRSQSGAVRPQMAFAFRPSFASNPGTIFARYGQQPWVAHTMESL